MHLRVIHVFSWLDSSFKKNKFIYFFIFGCIGSSLLRGLSLVVASGGYSVVVRGLLIVVASLVAEHGPRRAGFSSYGTWAQ